MTLNLITTQIWQLKAWINDILIRTEIVLKIRTVTFDYIFNYKQRTSILDLNIIMFTAMPLCLEKMSTSSVTVLSQHTQIGGILSMTCGPHHAWVAGNLTRRCLSNATWDGVEPVCEGEILINSYNQDRNIYILTIFKMIR